MNEKLNLNHASRFYEITMANGYFKAGMAEDIAYFDMFFRKYLKTADLAILQVSTK